MADDPSMHRRQFFRRGLAELLKPAFKAIEPTARALGELEKLDRPNQPAVSGPPAPVSNTLWLRPPGALREQDFLAACSRCGECVRVCPAEAIKISADAGHGAPHIDADTRACAACDGLYCMSSCPTGALVPTPLVRIKMGTAVWHDGRCTRTTLGDDCRRCVDVCPIGTAAIDLSADGVQVKPLGCIGCGLCQQDCPTDPRAISVIPKAAREL
jgi:ferredoxin-type protein NapG